MEPLKPLVDLHASHSLNHADLNQIGVWWPEEVDPEGEGDNEEAGDQDDEEPPEEDEEEAEDNEEN
jgi:hypothetical protein